MKRLCHTLDEWTVRRKARYTLPVYTGVQNDTNVHGPCSRAVLTGRVVG